MVPVPHGILDSLESLQLPSIPQILLRFLSRAEDSAVSMAELAELVGQDPALAARVLTVANSAALRRGTATSSLTRCLVTLGTRLARTLAACLVIQKVFSPSQLVDRYDLNGFWNHTLCVADLCRTLAEQQQYPDPDEAYLAGLLHDVGQLLLLGGMEDRYGLLLAASRDETALLIQEQQRLGTDHAVIGAWLIDRWGFSDSFMADAVLFHHADADDISAADQLSRLLWAAHLISRHHRLYQAEQPLTPPEFDLTAELFGIDFSAGADLYRRSMERVALLAGALGVAQSEDGRSLPLPLKAQDPDAPRLAEAEPLLSPEAEAVRDMALLKPLQQDLAAVQQEAELFLAAQESARILFGLHTVAFLLRTDDDRLQGAPGSFQPELLQRIVIPLQGGSSLAAAALRERRPYCTLHDDTAPVSSLADAQITRILGTEGLLYLPMTGRTAVLGVMVCGVSAAFARRLRQRLTTLVGFAGAAAVGIESWRQLQAAVAGREADAAQRFEQQAARIAHEAGNPLTIIRTYLSVMHNKLPQEADVAQELEVLKEEIDRVTQILQRMGAPAPSAEDRLGTDANAAVTSLLTLYRAALFDSRGISVQLDLEPGLPAVAADRDRLKQILLNLWNNAADALSSGCRVQVTTRSGFVFNGRRCIELAVGDNGPGLPDDVMGRLFSPLPPGRRQGHAGLGLSLVADLVAQLEGQITCRSTQSSGTAFLILLPVAAGGAP